MTTPAARNASRTSARYLPSAAPDENGRFRRGNTHASPTRPASRETRYLRHRTSAVVRKTVLRPAHCDKSRQDACEHSRSKRRFCSLTSANIALAVCRSQNANSGVRLQSRDVMSQHQGAKRFRRFRLLGIIRLSSRRTSYPLSDGPPHMAPPDHYDFLPYLLDLIVLFVWYC